MKFLFLLTCLIVSINSMGCMLESSGESNNTLIDNNNKTPDNYYNNNSNVSNICPPPYSIIVMLDGKPTQQWVVQPCYMSNTNNIVSDKDWGNSEDHTMYVPSDLPNLKNSPPGDPIPHD